MPVFSSSYKTNYFQKHLNELIVSIKAEVLESNHFSLNNYFYNGCPFLNNSLSIVSKIIVEKSIEEKSSPKKILVTDLDNTFWSGIIGEDFI